MVATLHYPPYIYLNPAGFTADGSMKYKMTGYFAEVFDNLQVSFVDHIFHTETKESDGNDH